MAPVTIAKLSTAAVFTNVTLGEETRVGGSSTGVTTRVAEAATAELFESTPVTLMVRLVAGASELFEY